MGEIRSWHASTSVNAISASLAGILEVKGGEP